MERLTRKEQKDKTRLGLVERAEQLFAKKGISSTTTADIAKALKVSHGTVFIHFATRDDLVLAVVEKFGEKLAEALGAKLSSGMSLQEILRAHVAVLAKFEDFYLRLISESQSLSPHVRSLVYSMNSNLSYRLDQAARGPMAESRLKRLRQADLFNTWMALLNHQVMNRDLFSEKTPILEHEGERIVQLFLTLIENPSNPITGN